MFRIKMVLELYGIRCQLCEMGSSVDGGLRKRHQKLYTGSHRSCGRPKEPSKSFKCDDHVCVLPFFNELFMLEDVLSSTE